MVLAVGASVRKNEYHKRIFFLREVIFMLLYKLLLTLNATSWMAIIYAIKEGWTILKIPSHLFGIMLLAIPILLSWLSIILSRFLRTESSVGNCKEFNLADGEFLPTYLGYFFVSVGVSEHFTMAVVYLIVFVFTFLSQTQYYNPIHLLFGYHYYHVSTESGTRIFVIRKGPIIRNIKDLRFDRLHRLNNSTFIEKQVSFYTETQRKVFVTCYKDTTKSN